MKLLRVSAIFLAVLGLIAIAGSLLAPPIFESVMNKVTPHPPYEISDSAKTLHQSLLVTDLHSDSTLWKRDLLQRADRGHVDVPRMREGNVALQMFTSVTKSPRGQNYQANSEQAADNITLVTIMQTWPTATWTSLTARALYQAEKLKAVEQRSPDEFQMVYTAADLQRLMERRAANEPVVGGVLGTEGSHALDGTLENISTLYDAGFRMMSLQHFFDNKLGGSLHGESGAGLTPFGKQAVDQMVAMGVIIDVSHSSEAVVADVISRTDAPLIVSHTGFYGHCQSPRNISDTLMKAIASGGGIIGVGFWDGAVCDASPAGVVAAIRYGIDLVGVDHVALGSDFDGTVETTFDISELAVLTDEMLKAGFTETEIRKVMGENTLRYLATNLPRG